MNHDRINIHTSVGASCALWCISRISSETDDALYALASRLYHPSRGEPCATIIASDVRESQPTNTDKLMARAEELGFCGDLIRSSPVENPRTGNVIHTYLWDIEHEPFKKWYQDQRVARLARVGS